MVGQSSSFTMTEAIKNELPVDSAAWSFRLIAEFDAADQKARELATGLSPEHLNWQPEPDAWSVGQCLEHLCLMNELYSLTISSSLEGKPASVAKEITLGWFSRWFIHNYSEPSLSKRARAPKKIMPGARVESSVLDRFLRSNQVARGLVCHAGSYDVNRIRFRNPFIPLLRFTVGLDSWFDGQRPAKLVPSILHPFPTGKLYVQENNEVIGFLAGFVSQTDPRKSKAGK